MAHRNERCHGGEGAVLERKAKSLKTPVPKTGTKIALVTGANRGIGLAIVAGLAKHSDIKVLLGSRNLRDGEEAAAGTQGRVVAVALDLSDHAQLQKQYVAIVAAHGEAKELSFE
jgi:NAD(P)-dependent dehydrogenase (short-subunit alcohol dehydrogenase family)